MMETNQFTKADWTLFRQRVPKWQEAYMDKILEEYCGLITSDARPSERFWALEKRLREDKRSPGVLIDMRRSKFLSNLCALLRDGVITMDDLEGFSDELKEYMTMLFSRRNDPGLA